MFSEWAYADAVTTILGYIVIYDIIISISLQINSDAVIDDAVIDDAVVAARSCRIDSTHCVILDSTSTNPIRWRLDDPNAVAIMYRAAREP